MYEQEVASESSAKNCPFAPLTGAKCSPLSSAGSSGAPLMPTVVSLLYREHRPLNFGLTAPPSRDVTARLTGKNILTRRSQEGCFDVGKVSAALRRSISSPHSAGDAQTLLRAHWFPKLLPQDSWDLICSSAEPTPMPLWRL